MATPTITQKVQTQHSTALLEIHLLPSPRGTPVEPPKPHTQALKVNWYTLNDCAAGLVFCRLSRGIARKRDPASPRRRCSRPWQPLCNGVEDFCSSKRRINRFMSVMSRCGRRGRRRAFAAAEHYSNLQGGQGPPSTLVEVLAEVSRKSSPFWFAYTCASSAATLRLAARSALLPVVQLGSGAQNKTTMVTRPPKVCFVYARS